MTVDKDMSMMYSFSIDEVNYMQQNFHMTIKYSDIVWIKHVT